LTKIFSLNKPKFRISITKIFAAQNMNSCCSKYEFLLPKKKFSAAHFCCQKSNFAAQKNKNVAAQKNNFAAQSNKFAAHFTNSLKFNISHSPIEQLQN
jgi:hypothetical protein